MARRPPLAAAALVVMVVLAGCNVLSGGDSTATVDRQQPTEPTPTPETAPTGTATRTPTEQRSTSAGSTPTPTDRTSTPTEAPDGDPASAVGESAPVEVEGDLPVNATRIYRRVERLMNVSADAPVVRVFERDRIVSGTRIGRVQRALGFGNGTGDWQECRAAARARATRYEVVVDPRNISAESLELLLAHEFVHTLQQQVDGYRNAFGDVPSGITRSVIEGSAVYVAETYARRYDKRWDSGRPLEIYECIYRRAESHRRLTAGQYYFGGRYFERRIDSPTTLSAVFESPPRTTEQVIHGETPATEPAVPLSVRPADGERTTPTRRSGGELLVRTWLSTGLPDARVDTAASGWGNDTVLVPSTLDRSGVAWVIRWETAADAEEFAAAVGDLEPALESQNATSVRSVRVSPETVVVFAGSERWVSDAAASGSSGNVTVSLPR